MWYLDVFKYTEFNGGVHFFCKQSKQSAIIVSVALQE